MRVGITALPQPYPVCAPPRCSLSSRDRPLSLKFFSSGLHKLPKFNLNFRCNFAGDSGGNQSKAVLDAFLLGKAVGEALNERVESAVGEFLSTVGGWQAEQQKQIQEFQEEVLEKARRAKDQAAREVMEGQGLTSKSTAAVEMIPTVNGAAASASSVSNSVISADSSLESKRTIEDPPDDE